MSDATVNCGACRMPLPSASWNSSGPAACPSCEAVLRALVFPAFARPLARGDVGERVLADSEASCFYHPQKKAATVCDRCGRFLCSLCDVDLPGEHVCPGCLQSGVSKGRLERLEASRILYDDIALALAVWPMVLFCFACILTAPMALYYAIRHWNTPCSVVPRSKVRFVLAIVLACLQLIGLAVFIVITIREGV